MKVAGTGMADAGKAGCVLHKQVHRAGRRKAARIKPPLDVAAQRDGRKVVRGEPARTRIGAADAQLMGAGRRAVRHPQTTIGRRVEAVEYNLAMENCEAAGSKPAGI